MCAGRGDASAGALAEGRRSRPTRGLADDRRPEPSAGPAAAGSGGAANAACYAEASRFEDTHWAQILFLYDLLLEVQPSPIVRLNRAAVLARVHGPSAGLAELESLSAVLHDYHLLHAIAGQLQSDLGHHAEARASEVRAAGLTANAAEQALLSRRIQLLDAIC